LDKSLYASKLEFRNSKFPNILINVIFAAHFTVPVASSDHPIRSRQYIRRDCEADSFAGFQVDHFT
jgi:hypothetical protein